MRDVPLTTKSRVWPHQRLDSPLGRDAVHHPCQIRLVQQSTRVQDCRVGRASQHPSDADPPHACPCQLAGAKRPSEHVDRFRRHGGNHGLDGDEVRQRRRVPDLRSSRI